MSATLVDQMTAALIKFKTLREMTDNPAVRILLDERIPEIENIVAAAAKRGVRVAMPRRSLRRG